MKQLSRMLLAATTIAACAAFPLSVVLADGSSEDPAQPQSAATPADRNASTRNAESPPVETIVVTGSLIPTEPGAVAVPVISLDSKAIEQNGVVTNPLEILRKSIPSFAGRSNSGTSNANNDNQRTAGGSQVQLRNLPTLILINGRRMANSGIGGINGKNFVDVNQIPAAAIDHIEVLTDGASSLYGSDAIGGVVNFILKSDYNGLDAGGRFGTAQDGYRERSAYLTGGTEFGGINITATASILKTEPLLQNARSFTSPLFGKTSAIPGVVAAGGVSPGAILAPGVNSPSALNPTGTAATANTIADLIANGTYVATTPAGVSASFDVSPFQTLLLQQEQDAFVTSLRSKMFDSRIEVFGDVMYSRSKSFTQWLPIGVTGITVPAGAPFNPLTANFTGVTFDYLPRPKQFDNDVKAVRVTAGLRGEFFSDWSWETGIAYGQSELEQLQSNVIFKPNIARAIAGGFDVAGNAVTGGVYSKVYGNFSVANPLVLQPALDPFARAGGVNPAALENLYGVEQINARSQLESIDAKVVGKVFELPAGNVGLAVGASARRETLSGHTDANGRVTDPATGLTTGNSQLWQGGTFADPFKKHRDISALFVETRLPVTSASWNVPGFHAFDLTAALRAEKYSDAGRSTVPKFGFRWEPLNKQFTLHGDYSESFSAPSLYAEYGPTDTRQVGAGVIQGVFGANYTGMPFNGEDGNNPDLKPATSSSRSIGITFHPEFAHGLTVSADFSSISLHGFAGGLGFNNILLSINALGSASPYFSNLAVDNFPGSPGATQPFTQPGDLKAFLTSTVTGNGDPVQANRLYLIDQFRNLATLIEHSYIVNVEYVVSSETYGTLTFSTAGAIFAKFNFQDLPGHAFIEYAGHTNNAGASGGFGGTLPKYRFFTTFDWAYRSVDLTLSNTYVSATTDTGVNGTSTPPIAVARYVAWDFRAAYDWKLESSASGRAVTFALGINNFTNQMPPLAPRAFLDNNADVATFSPIGRLIYGSVAVKF